MGSRTVELNKIGGSFGFSLRGYRAPFSVGAIKKDGAAQTSGLVIGDIVKQVNATDLDEISIHQAIKLIQQAGDSVKLTIEKEGTSIAEDRPKESEGTMQVVQASAEGKVEAVSLPQATTTETDDVQEEETKEVADVVNEPASVEPVAEESQAVAELEIGAVQAEGEPTSEPAREPDTVAAPVATEEPAEPAVTEEPAEATKGEPQADADTVEESMPKAAESATDETEQPDAEAVREPTVGNIGGFSLCGTKHGDVNQDSFVIENVVIEGTTIHVCAAFDGHGLLGERAASAASDTISSIASQQRSRETSTFDLSNFLTDGEAAMRKLFTVLQTAVLAVHKDPPEEYLYPTGPSGDGIEFKLEDDPDFEKAYIAQNMPIPKAPIDFGCTAAVAVIFNNTLIVGNAGDAAAILVCDAPSDSEDEFVVDVLSEVHTATAESEIERVERDFPGLAFMTPDGYLAPLDDKLSQYEVQITRSLGHDLLREVGVISKPVVSTLDLAARRARGLVLCSDGVTDELQQRDITDRAMDAHTALSAAETLCNDAHSFVMNQAKVDDCTAVVVHFNILTEC